MGLATQQELSQRAQNLIPPSAVDPESAMIASRDAPALSRCFYSGAALLPCFRRADHS
jgi:hypothetical protein